MILHINSYLVCSHFYWNLYDSLHSRGLKQKIFVPAKAGSRWNAPQNFKGYECEVGRFQTQLDRVFFSRKIRKGLQHLSTTAGFDAKQIQVAHAHTWFSDGFIARALNKQNGTPFVVAVRNTDLNVFWKFFPHLRSKARDVLERASQIICLSPAYEKRLANAVGEEFWDRVRAKVLIIPNGIDDFWHASVPDAKSAQRQPKVIKALYVGRFDKNKNVQRTIDACEGLRKKGFDVTFRLVGGRPEEVQKLREKFPLPWVEAMGVSTDITELIEHYRWADVFVMASHHESFGLVYAEALSQSIPVVYTRNEGFDGWCPDPSCGLGVDPTSTSEIQAAIEQLKVGRNPESCIKTASPFRWDTIADQYLKIYNLRADIPSSPAAAL